MDQPVESLPRGIPSAGGNTPTGPSNGLPFGVVAPTIELPKGGGAIQGIGEKFAANPVTGTGSMTVPLPTSPGRSGFGPELSLSYDSGAGNGPFGFGWSLNLPTIARKTDTGLPRYDDAGSSDVFILSGAEDLVPALDIEGSHGEDRSVSGYLIHRYRPRIEGLFARIERWTRISDGDVHWRSFSRDNVLTLYGKDAGSRVADSADARHVFSWLICETRDDKGNLILYEYKADDGAGIDLGQAHERNRGPGDDPRRSVNRYLKRIRYGNRLSALDPSGQRPRFLSDSRINNADWMFEATFDYGEHDLVIPRPSEIRPWLMRPDPFSSYRPGFEVRTSRRCRRMLMFHHFDGEPGVGNDCLVRSTDFEYSDELRPPDPRNPIHSFLRSVTQSGYRREETGYLKRSWPPVEFDYSVPDVQGTVHDVDPSSLENLPAGLSGPPSLWTDLDGEGIPGLLTAHAGAWYYKRNLSPTSAPAVEFSPLERVTFMPNFDLAGGQAQLMDLAGNGRPDLVVMEGPTPGFHEHSGDEGWGPFRSFSAQLRRDTRDPNLRFVDLDGDGHLDVLITEDDALVWHPSLAEDGFGPAQRVQQALDEEAGPRLIFADRSQSVYLADMNADGLIDLVRIRNGEVSFWPNLGHGRFGAKVSMDQAPQFDRPDGFDQRRVRVSDVDGDGTADLIYLAGDGVRVWFNQSGNSWSAGQRVAAFPPVDDLAAIQVVDLMGNGTACLVWSSPLPGAATRPMRYVDLMGGHKPHLMVRSANNLGAETVVHYAPSTRFYLADKLAGTPWLTKLPFPVQLVERVEIFDRVSGNRFVTRYAYHHGHFDGVEREFRGFGRVDRFDTEEFAALSDSADFPSGTNIEASSHVPPIVTRTWFHTGVYLGHQSVSNFFAGLVDAKDTGEYYREPDLIDDEEAGALLLDDTVLPPDLSLEEEREACRALKGAVLRQEIYALDGSDDPYTVAEQNVTIRMLQPRADNRHAVFLTHARESITFNYERNSADPRITHALTLEADGFGNILTSADVAYGRREPDPALSSTDQLRQSERHVTCSENAFTNAIDSTDAYRVPVASESRSYELVGLKLNPGAARLGFDQVLTGVASADTLAYEEPFTPDTVQKRLIEHVRTQYRPDDLGAAKDDPLALLPLGLLESLAITGESYKLALTPGLVARNFGDKVTGTMLETEARFVHHQGDLNWWLRSGRTFLSPGINDDPATELAHARQHFFQASRFRDPFHRVGFETESVIRYDYDFFVRETRDALGNRSAAVHDYRVLQPRLLTDSNGNRTEVAFDALGMVVGTAVMGKATETKGDSLLGLVSDLDEAEILAHLDDPLAEPHSLLQQATTRMLYDVFSYLRTRDQARPQPAVVYALARETHHADLVGDELTRVQHSLSYSDGFGRQIQKKVQAEPGPLVPGSEDISPRWVGSGWTIFNNKGKPVRQYEPFFSPSHRFEFARIEGVSPVLCYDPLGRVVATLHPDHAWAKVVFDAWHQVSWDRNDTVLLTDPSVDRDVGSHVSRIPEKDYLPGWQELRVGGAMGPWEQGAAQKAAIHAATPSTAYTDSLGRTFLTVAHNRLKRSDSPVDDPPEESFARTRVSFDIEGNQIDVIDALGRVVMHVDYDMLGNQIRSASIDAGERWVLNDVAGKALYSWDSRDSRLRRSYDVLGRPAAEHLQTGTNAEKLVSRFVYGEAQPTPETQNLRGKPFQAFDGAGVVTTADYDFKGNALSTSRQLAVEYKAVPDWSTAVELEAEIFITRTEFDALNRPISQTTPDGGTIGRTYNAAGLLETVEANLRGESAGSDLVWTQFVTDIDYDAKGQRERIEFGNGVVTTVHYDPLTFRLLRLQTRGGAGRLQDLSYTYDPIGNITHIHDDAHQPIFFRNTRVEPSNDYSYDSTYRLTEAAGREHLGQSDGNRNPPTPPDAFNLFHSGLAHPGDSKAMGRFLERYTYDSVGNLEQLQHVGSDPAHPGWTRANTYAAASQIEPDDVHGNRLTSTQIGSGQIERYRFDSHGNMISMPHLALVRWNYRDELEASARQVIDDETPETTYYVYDGGGRRVRKVTERSVDVGEPVLRKSERIYLGEFELYREYQEDGVEAGLERQSLHVADGEQRIALVETRTQGDDGSAEQLVRYQNHNHLGSTSLELDGAGAIISYEECYPHGSTSYQALNSSIKAAAKRYRYTGKERDEETGLCYHGARYLLPTIARWISADPAGLADGVNLYAYARNNPVSNVDTNGKESFNAGERGQTFSDEQGNTFVEFRAKQGTWVSASAKSLGLDTRYTKEQGYGAYVGGNVLNSAGLPFADTDKLKVGEVYYIRTGGPSSRPAPVPPKPLPPEPVPGPPEPTPEIEEEGWGKYILRNAVDFVFFDKVSIEGHAEAGGGGTVWRWHRIPSLWRRARSQPHHEPQLTRLREDECEPFHRHPGWHRRRGRC